MANQVEGKEKAIASAVGSLLTVLVAFNVMEMEPTSIEGVMTGVAALATPILTWLTANTKKDQ